MPKFIAEGAIIQEAKMVKEYPNKAIFRMVMQTVDEVNQNKRLYPKIVLSNAMGECEPRMKRRAFYGELDHPIPEGKDEFDTVRQTTVLLKEVAIMILSYEFSGNKLIGELETCSTDNGYKVHGLLRDRSGFGLSMRGLGELERKPGFIEVKDPLTIIGYDCVSLPSHKPSVVDFNEVRFVESVNIVERKSSVCVDGVCYLPDYFDKLVESGIIKFNKKWV